MAKERTEAQKEASRLNGQKSQGPKTAEGKAIAARNALRHGLNSPDVVLWCENKEEYELDLLALKDEWRPKTLTELQYVTTIAQCNWRLRRLMIVETATIDFHMHRTVESFDELLSGYDEQTRLAFAWQDLAARSGSLNQIQRHETHLRRTLDRCVSKLLAIGESRRKHAARAKKDSAEPWTLNGLSEETGSTLCENEPEPWHDQNCENEPEPAQPVPAAHGPLATSENCGNEPEPELHQHQASESPNPETSAKPQPAVQICENEPELSPEPTEPPPASLAELIRRYPGGTLILTTGRPKDKAA